MKITVNRPEQNTAEAQQRRFQEYGISWGAAAVYKVGGNKHYKIYATADRTHCPKESPTNITALLKIMLNENLCYIGKAYDSDMYRGHGNITQKEWENIQQHESYKTFEVLN